MSGVLFLDWIKYNNNMNMTYKSELDLPDLSTYDLF